MSEESKKTILDKIGNLGGPVLFILFLVFLLVTGGVGAVFDFAKDYADFLITLLLGCIVFGIIFGSVMFVFEKTDKKFGTSAAVTAMFLYILIGLPLIALILDIFI